MKTAVLAALAASAAAQKYPVFPNQWAAFVETIMVQNQGNYNLPNGDFCCAVDSNCQLQLQYSAGMTYFDLPNNRTSDVYGAEYQPYAIVSLYNQNVEAAVDSTFTCTSYCPIDEGPMEAYNVNGYTDMGPTTILGQKAEAWQMIDQLPFGNITMEVDTIYVDQSNFNSPRPILEVDDLTPFGQVQIGQRNQTFTQWKAGAPDAKWFAVNGLAKCPQDSNCGSDARQLYRLRTRQKGLFMKYAMAKKRAADAAKASAGFQVPHHMIEAAKAEHKARLAGKHHRLGAKRHHKGDESDSDAE